MDRTKQNSHWRNLITLLLFLVALGLMVEVPIADATDILWYDHSWSNRKLMNISNNTESELTDYQVLVNVTHDPEMQPDFDDIRFTDIDGATSISHWMESYTESASAKFWVRVPSIPPGSTMIWMYYGNSSANSASDGKATFELFDDFNDGIIDPMWRVYTNASEANGLLAMINTGEVGIETYVNPPLSDFAVKIRIDIATETYPAGSRIRIWGQNWIPFEYKYWWGSWGHKGFFTYNYNTEQRLTGGVIYHQEAGTMLSSERLTVLLGTLTNGQVLALPQDHSLTSTI